MSEERMRAIVQSGYGGTEVWQLGEVDRPTIADNEVLVKVHAAGLDRGTWHLMRGEPYAVRLVFGLRTPKNPVPGLDLAGVVVEVGAKVTRFAVGDEVYGIGKGSLAEYTAAREGKLVPKPEALTFEQAASVAVSGLTAVRGLCDVARIKDGDKVLITGASGGVGSFAVQIAKAIGAEVTGVCQTSKVDLVRRLGADRVIDYTTDDYLEGSTKYDVILDIGGSASLARLRGALPPKGTLVIVGGEGGSKWGTGIGRQLKALAVSPFVKQRLTMLVAKEQASDMQRLSDFIEAGQLMPAVERTYPLAEAAVAMKALDAGEVRGKVVIAM